MQLHQRVVKSERDIHYAIFSPTLENRDEAYIEGKNGELRFTNKARA